MAASTIRNLFIENRQNRTVIRLEQGDLTALAADAIVFYAAENLELGTGYGTAIQSRGGAAVKDDLKRLGSVRAGEAVITRGGALAARHVIHACGPKFQEPETEPKLRECLRSALQVAADNGLKTIALPPMGTGFYGIPLALSARVTLEVIREFLRSDSSLEEIAICVIDKRDFLAFQPELEAL
jgi:O-acetyl-ADP-ribose deacetylase (regulator of RNase III)